MIPYMVLLYIIIPYLVLLNMINPYMVLFYIRIPYIVFISIIGVVTAVIANLFNVQDYYLFYGYITVVVCLWILDRIKS